MKPPRSENLIFVVKPSKNDVIKAAAKLQKKIHPDLNRDVNTEELSKLVNEAKEKLLKELV